MERKKRQTYNDGICTIFKLDNVALPGAMPKEGLIKKNGPIGYEEQRVGVTRFYAAQRNEERIDLVIRVPRCGEISTLDVCIPIDKQQYRIRQAQKVPDVSPESLDLALERLGAGYDFA